VVHRLTPPGAERGHIDRGFAGETERYVHRLPDQTLAQRARAAIDHAFPVCGAMRAGHGTGQAGPASRSEAADFAD